MRIPFQDQHPQSRVPPQKQTSRGRPGQSAPDNHDIPQLWNGVIHERLENRGNIALPNMLL
jgi:hypothetical protein